MRGEGLVVQAARSRSTCRRSSRSEELRHQGRPVRAAAPAAAVQEITLDGLEINIPPGGPDFKAQHYGRAANPGCADQPSSSPIHIERLESTDAVLRLIPKRAGKEPREFLIHRLTMEGVGIDQRMPFQAELTNPIPRGAIRPRAVRSVEP